MKRYFIGIDPGKTGAVAIITDSGYADVFDFGMDSLKALTVLAEKEKPFQILAIIEAASSFSSTGQAQGGLSMVNYGKAYGEAQGWLRALKIPQDVDVRPDVWKRDLRLNIAPLKKQSDKKKQTAAMTAWRKKKKEVSFELARRLFPVLALDKLTRQKDHNRAEALLIAEWLRRRFLFKEPDYNTD